MKYDRSELKEYYKHFSNTLGEITRTLSFAGIGVIWIFVVVKEDKSVDIPNKLVIALTCFVLALAFELLHYIYGTAVHGLYNRHLEKKETGKEKKTCSFSWSRYWNWPKLFSRWGSVFLLTSGYVFTIIFLTQKIDWKSIFESTQNKAFQEVIEKVDK